MSEILESSLEETLLLKKRKLALLRKKEAYRKSNALAFYLPHPKQDQFHRAGEFKYRMVRAGNRFGKSLMGCAEDVAWMLNERVWYPKTDPARVAGIPQRPNKILVITTDWDKVDEIWTSERGQRGKLWHMLPDGSVKTKKRNHQGVIDQISLQNGSSITFDTVKSWMSNPQGSESSDWDAIHVDEPCPEGMYKAASRGLMDRDGSSWFTLTPLSEPWIQDMFFPNGRNQTEFVRINSEGRKQYWATSGATLDNPTLSKEAIADFENTLSADERQCRLYGIPLFLSGLVYKEFDPARHVLQNLPAGWQDYSTPPADYTVYAAIDPHPQTPHAVLFCAVSPLGQKFFFQELFIHTTIADLATRIRVLLGAYNNPWIKCDPLAYITDPITDRTWADEFASWGVYVEKAVKDLSGGILKTKEELRKENNIYFSPTLTRTLWEINRYCWSDKENKPVDKDDHMMENFYRLNLSDMIYIPKVDPHNKPIHEYPIRDELNPDRDSISYLLI